MSDDQAVDTVAKVGTGALLGSPLLLLFVKRFFRKSDEEKAALMALLGELKAENKQLRERLEGALAAHRTQLEAEREARHALALKVQDHETRLRTREGRSGEPMTNPGYRLSPELAEAVAKYREEEP